MGYWLMGTAGMVFAMVVLGGVTRLTRSGLSIVEWRPEGEKLPSTDAEWQVEFEKYKAFPEYQKVNLKMTLDEFKPIYFMEWAHRMWGRAIGVAFGLPLVYFVASKSVPKGFGVRLGVLLGLGAAQGGVGWWMVKSGLEHDRFQDNYVVPRVSPYRLTTHLGFAWTLYSLLLWNGWDLLRKQYVATPQMLTAAQKARTPVMMATALIGTTIASGAFVAGNDAGHAYNDWPFFAGKLIPEEIWEEKLGIRNIFENTATVQFDHRMLAYTSILAVGGIHAACKRAGWADLPPGARKGAIGLGALITGQALLGITTLMNYVPVELGAAHQAGALALWTGALYTLHSLSMTARQAGLVASIAAANSKAGAAGAAAAEYGAKLAAARTPAGAAAASAAAVFFMLSENDNRRSCREDE